MSESIFPYYERELKFLRELGREFAAQFPQRAGLLGLHQPQNVDPHVERMIESVALLTGRIQHKLDDEFPELTDALLAVLYPHYLAPIPSLGIVQFEPDPLRADLSRGFRIERASRLQTDPVEYQDATSQAGDTKALKCLYRTCYPVTLWPITVTAARLAPPPFPNDLSFTLEEECQGFLSLRLEWHGQATFAQLGETDLHSRPLSRLRFYLEGDASLVAPLYELLFTGVIRILIRSLDKEVGEQLVLRPEACLFPVGFEKDEALLPYPPQSFRGYGLLSEFFAFPRKFFFFDLGGFERLRPADLGKQLEVLFFLRQAEPTLVAGVKKQTFQLGCTPVVNLFEEAAEPIAVTQATHEYRVVPKYAQEGGLEVYSVDRVHETDAETGASREYRPFFSFQHEQTGEAAPRLFWYASRRPSLGGSQAGTDVYLSLVDLDFQPWQRNIPVLHTSCTCTNRNLARNLLRMGERSGLRLQQVAPLSRVRWVGPITQPMRPPQRHGGYWRLLSHLNLNHLSLVGGNEGRDALKELLRLYNLSADRTELPDAILAVEANRIVDRLHGAPASGFARGLEITIEFDRDKCLSTSVYLFAGVLERFLGLYTSINSFSRLIARVRSEKRELKRWPARAGEQSYL